jgi:glyoxylase-like metal-dependent hydrolase (beta-lactamase superfamily II)
VDPLPIVALTTGRVRIHDDMHRGRGPGPVRRARILRKGPMGRSRPIHAWLIDHPDEGRILVDAGETHAAVDTSFATFAVAREDELDHQLRDVAGIEPQDVDRVILTHVHGDHVDGLPHVAHAPAFASARELAVTASLAARATRRLTRQPLPEPFVVEPLALDGPRVGAFASSTPLTADGRVIAIPTPGHTPGHLSVLVVQPGHHVLLAGDACYDLAQLQDLHVDGVSPKAPVAKDTMKRILAHAAGHPTVILPSHDRDAARRLAATEVLRRRPAHAED